MSKLKATLAAASMLLSLTSASIAQDAEAAKLCAQDIKSLCASVQPGEGRIKACITSNFSKLSDSCQEVLHKAAAVGEACKADVVKLCAGIQPGGGRIEACVKAHAGDLSSGCKDSLAEATAGKT